MHLYNVTFDNRMSHLGMILLFYIYDVTCSYLHGVFFVRVLEVTLLRLRQFPLQAFFSSSASKLLSCVAPMARPMVLN